MDFQNAHNLFQRDRIQELAKDSKGLRFLKLRSLARKEHLVKLFEHAGVSPSTTSAKPMFKEAFNSTKIADELIEGVITEIYEAERQERREAEDFLVSQLYKLEAFDWGGLHQNSLERTIVNNYVKRIKEYNLLGQKIENELHNSMRGYVLCSWYNHWTSIIIEDLFRDHDAVLPAVGQVKKIDFFVNDVPFDLKVTSLPEGFITERRKREGKKPELSLLKQAARKLGVHYEKGMSDGRLMQDLWLKLSDHPDSNACELIEELQSFRVDVLQECHSNPADLITWLYENQGFARFDASNRLFLLLVDTNDFFQSWKLKRAKPLLQDRIRSYLDNVGSRPGKEIHFDWDGRKYSTLSDLVFVTHS